LDEQSSDDSPFHRDSRNLQIPALKLILLFSRAEGEQVWQPENGTSRTPQLWGDENTSRTRKRGVGIIPRLRFGLVFKPLGQLLAAISSAHPNSFKLLPSAAV